ncbi:MAG TPA: transporter [Thermoanaerobaculia bacterium]
MIGIPTRFLAALAASALGAAVTGAGVAGAQDLEPRAYSASPVGLNFAVLGYVYSTGDIVFDPSLPITNASARINAVALGYGRTFALFGRQALVTAVLPYAWGNAEGDVGEEHRAITRSGLADLKAKFSVNLLGNPAVTPAEFARERHDRVLVAASLALSAPSGQYDETKLINLGTNRWAFKPELGVAVPWKSFDFDAYAGVILFTRNPRFYPGASTRDQDPLATIQAHASYTFRPGLWLAADFTWYSGGAAHVDDGPAVGRQDNTRIGGTLAIPLGRQHSVKVAYSRGASVRVGQDFETFGVAWQFRWF